MQVQVIPGAVRMLYEHAEDLVPDDLRADGECDCDGPCCKSHVQEGGFPLECTASQDESDAVRERIKTLKTLARAEGIDPSTLPIGDIARDAEHVGFMIDHLRRMVTDPLELYIASKEESAEGITCALFTRVFGSSGLFADDEEVPSFSPARPTIGRVWVKTDSGYVLRA